MNKIENSLRSKGIRHLQGKPYQEIIYLVLSCQLDYTRCRKLILKKDTRVKIKIRVDKSSITPNQTFCKR